MAMRWKLDPKETGLRAVGAGPRGSMLHEGGKVFARVYALRRNYATAGWYWVAGWNSGVPHNNTCDEPVETEADAKAAAAAYVKKFLAQQKEQQ